MYTNYYFKVLFSLALSLLLVACSSVPKDAFKLTESSVQARQIQSRSFNTKDETELLAVGIATLQDMGYQIDESEKSLGIVTATKDADATDPLQVAGAVALALLGGVNVPIDDNQKITVSFVTLPSREKDKFYARAIFQKVVWNTQGVVSKAETINDTELYKEFFDKLSKSLFLEANMI